MMASAGTVTAKATGIENGEHDAQGAGVDADGPTARLVHALEDDEDVFDVDEPEGGGGQEEPEAVDDHGAGGEDDQEGEQLAPGDGAAEAA